ncbi:MAG: hypothetical protein JXB19_08520 [Bacteroidales bacterium]|nr:hypothetical protein [Bacteroidales bacterium]
MKTLSLTGLMIAFIIGACATPEETSPLEGTWKLISHHYVSDTLTMDFPGNYDVDMIKMWSKEHFVFVGWYRNDTMEMDNFGGGTYMLEGTGYQEEILYHTAKDWIGTTMQMVMEIGNDTLVQTYPVDENEQVDPGNYSQETWVKID